MGSPGRHPAHLAAGVGSALDEFCWRRGGRFTLIRRPGPPTHARTTGPAPDGLPRPAHRAALAAPGAARRPGAAAWSVAGAALAQRRHGRGRAGPDPGLSSGPPALLVCTNARRDLCCAVRGRPLALEAAAARPGSGLGVLAHWRSPVRADRRPFLTAQTFARLTAG